jgi:glutaminyl-peptide cyclotransferase
VIAPRISRRLVKQALGRCALGAVAFFGAPSPHAFAQPTTVRPEIVATYPHDRRAFTQGLLLHEGKLYESTGLLGRSSLRRVVPATGAVEKSIDLASDVFAEGLALVGDRFFQLTWQNRVAFTYDLDFNAVGRFDYTGEGWGLCYDGKRLVMSDGSSKLYFRNATTFEVMSEVEVRNANGPVANLNELECVGSLVYANVWQTPAILRIDPTSGEVLTTIDASGLLTPEEAVGTDVLNGVAFDPKTSHFLITGKLWPKLFEVRFAFDPGSNASATGGGGSSAGSGGSSGTNASGSGGGKSSGGKGGIGESGGSSEADAPPEKAGRSRGTCGCALPGASGDTRWLALGTALGTLILRRRTRPFEPRKIDRSL